MVDVIDDDERKTK